MNLAMPIDLRAEREAIQHVQHNPIVGRWDRGFLGSQAAVSRDHEDQRREDDPGPGTVNQRGGLHPVA